MPRGRPRKNSTDDGQGVSYHDTILRNTISGDELHSYIERVENVNQQIADSQSDRRELYAEIKGAGYDTATVRAIVKERAMDADKRHAMEALMIEYMAALGDFAETPLGTAAADRIREAAE